ncbi:hypothetical protein CANINC_004149 [Pichia inconspicua]|uniref:Protein CSF1 n=1 Tax=Pichia inconspicua TaxID=52247 RepID=A0A4T0WXA3_9ASCO|nr:hypothetical protein CANINC_004149 [[Candida] inconspicua]
MDVTSSFVAKSVTSSANLNWVFLVNWIIAVFSAILFMFYLDRMLGILITFLVTKVFWRRRSRKLSVQSVKISFLGGRLFLKNMCIITKNELVMIHTCTITWQYWIRHVRKNQLYVQAEGLNDEANRLLPARFVVNIVGLESFIYNRSSAYDEIEKIINLENEKANLSNRTSSTSKKHDENTDSTLKHRNTQNESPQVETEKTNVKQSPSNSKMEETDWSSSSLDEMVEIKEVMDSTFLNFLPIEVKINKGALVLGNETTPQLYVASASGINGIIDATLPECKLDYYRTHYDFVFSSFNLHLKRNVSFKDMDSLEKEMLTRQQKNKTRKLFSMISGLEKSLRNIHAKSRPRVEQESSNQSSDTLNDDSDDEDDIWHGLERYLTRASTVDSAYSEFYDYEKQKLINQEYAKYSHILETEKCKLNYYYDSQGLIPYEYELNAEEIIPEPDIGNKGPPPRFGIDIVLSDATLTYGPWAENHRNAIQQLLFPTIYRHSAPMQKLQPGSRRQYISFDLSVQAEKELVLRIPHREASKDLDYLDKDVSTPRPFGWLDLKVGQGSIIEMSLALVTTENGTRNTLNAVFSNPEVLTSVNHDVFFKAEKHILNATIDFPLQWNSLAEWNFENISNGASLYLLREHVTLLTDLFGDFSSGEPTPYELFRPMLYHFTWKMYDYSFFLNINEQNIINNPLDSTINTYLTFRGGNLDFSVNIPITVVYKKSNTIDFNLSTEYFDLFIEHPASSTFANFLNTDEIGHSRNFTMDGSYTYYSLLEIDAVDTILMNCRCDDTTVKAYGFVVKYFMYLKDNYFGDTMHFQNLLEFRENYGKEETIHEGKRMKNETDFMFLFSVDNGCLVFPCHLYDCSSHLALHFDDLAIDVRNNNYYMDLQADFSEVRGRYIEECDEDDIIKNTISKVQFVPEIYIDDLSIHSIRLFGLPPTEPTYYCRWNFVTSSINIDSEPIFINALSRAGRSFVFGHADLENSMGLPVIPVTDILNLSFRCPSINVQVRRMDYCFKVNLDDIFFKLTDQPTPLYNSLINLTIQNISMECLLETEKLFALSTSLKMQNFVQKKNAYEFMKDQAMHLKKHDAPFHRTPFLIPEFAKDAKYYTGLNSLTSSIYLPDPPLPLTSQSIEMIIDGYPERIQRKLASLSSSYDDQDDDSNVDDYGHYVQFSSELEDFGVLKKLDPTCSYDNISIKLGELEIFVSPKLMFIAVDIVSNMIDFNMYSFLDELQSDFIAFYKYTQENIALRAKVECPIFTLKFSEQQVSKDFIFLGATDLTVAFSKESIQQKKSFNLYSVLKELNFDFVKDSHDTILLTLKNILLKHSTDVKSITTFDNEILSLYIDPVFLPGAAYVLLDYMGIAETAIERWNQLRKDINKAGIELLYDLSRGGIDYNISHDPPCITKPSYISGFSSHHIRLDGNWMIIPRLRHVLQNLPPDYIKNKNKMFSNRIWEAPVSAEDDVSAIFGNWRVWDNHKTKDNFILKKVFETVTKEKKSILKSAKFTFGTISLSINPFDKAMVISNTIFVFAEDVLSRNVKEMALPLLTTPIETAVDITWKMDSLAISMTKISLTFGELTEILDRLQKVKQKYLEELPSDTNSAASSIVSLKNVPIYESEPPKLITISFALAEYSCSLGVDKTVLSFYGQNSVFAGSLIQTDQILSCTMNSKTQYFGANFHVSTIPVLEVTCNGHDMSLVNTDSFKTGKSVLFFSNESTSISFLPDTKRLVKVITILMEHEYAIMKPVLEMLKNMNTDGVSGDSESCSDTDSDHNQSSYMASVIEKVQNKVFSSITCDVTISFKTAKTIFHVELISPFFLNYEVLGLEMSFRIGDFGAVFQCDMSHSKLQLGSQTKSFLIHYTESTADKVNWLVAMHEKEEAVEVLVRAAVGLIRLNFSQSNLIYMIERGQSDLRIADNNLTLLKKTISKYSSDSNTKTSASSCGIAKVVHMVFDIRISAINASVNVNGNKLHLDIYNPHVSLRTYDQSLKTFMPCGTVSLPSIRLAIALVNVHGISTLLDMCLLIELKNPETTTHKVQRLNLTSDFCRVVLSPHIVEELIEAYGDTMIVLDTVSNSPGARMGSEQCDENGEDSIDTILSFVSINIESNNFCVGWLFNEEEARNVVPGLIVGFEKTSFICATGAGKFQTQGMYLSTAHGFTPTTFYSSGSERNSENRAYFPQFDFIYTVERDEFKTNFKSQVTGDRVDFKFQTDILSIMEPIWNSVNILQERLTLVQHDIERKSQGKRRETVTGNFVDVKRKRSSRVITMSLYSKFDGASFFIYNSHIEIDGATPILNLQSPKISSVLKYTNDNNAAKKHAILLSAQILETHNKLSSQCSPIIEDLIRGCQHAMKQANKGARPRVESPSGSGLDFVRLSQKVDVNFTLKIEPQSLTLTCEPKANIEAEVGLEEIHLVVKTEQDFLSGVLTVKSMKSELKHVYSKVTSGSIKVHEVTVSSTVGRVNGARHISTLVKVTDIDAYVNIQQRQDLDLFRDFWVPNGLSLATRGPVKEMKKERTFASLMREVSMTTAFPWVVSLIIVRAEVKADLGSSLGTLTGYAENFHTLSIKSVNWDHNLKIQFDVLNLESVGRLSGSLLAHKVRMTSAISWKLHDEVLEIPLVLLAFGIGSLETNISLDYHPFFIFEIQKIGITTFNQRAKGVTDTLKSSISVQSMRAFMTALTASNFVDIYTIGLRIKQEIHLSYKQVLSDANIEPVDNTGDNFSNSATPAATFRRLISKLETHFDVDIGNTRVQIYPSNLLDSQALVIDIGRNRASFYQKTSDELLNRVLLDISNIKVSLSGFSEKRVEVGEVGEFVSSAMKTIDDNLFVFPSLKVGMKTIQDSESLVKYDFYCKFGGKVDIKWKIGSVYFIRQMWYSHATSLNERLVALRIFTSDEYDEENYKKNTLESVNLEERLKDVESDEKYVYIAIHEPDIETPQLKDLGSATPPLEWFGLHRDKFPNLTHQFVIIGLQKLIREVEEKYSQVLK